MLRRLIILVAVLALAAAAAGCGGGDGEAGGDTTVVVTETTDTTDESTTDETTTDESDTGSGVSGFPSGDCLQAVSAFGVLASAAASAAGVNADDSLETFQAFTDNAPDEIKDDLQVLASAYAEYIQTLSELGLEQGEVPDASQIAALTQASEGFSSSEFQAASDNWNAWLSANCPTG